MKSEFLLPSGLTPFIRETGALSYFFGSLSVLFIKKREHRINVDLFRILHGLHLRREENCHMLKRDRFKLKGEFVCETEN
ncbi:hypothetical protein RG963_01730 [Methanosarcina sp. Z-7115]|uniref:Uncharacterized protein n=1 Tax=Methanosarcina baikalica TaxID=3073890 RepID=A0ABU2CXQ2_9EURY|nr:hypothetical protein [Methanosarcina sp. Z-7115]MDR7664522.1 hypothetical protein [Methanosarcina sp. Z-7115]